MCLSLTRTNNTITQAYIRWLRNNGIDIGKFCGSNNSKMSELELDYHVQTLPGVRSCHIPPLSMWTTYFMDNPRQRSFPYRPASSLQMLSRHLACVTVLLGCVWHVVVRHGVHRWRHRTILKRHSGGVYRQCLICERETGGRRRHRLRRLNGRDGGRRWRWRLWRRRQMHVSHLHRQLRQGRLLVTGRRYNRLYDTLAGIMQPGGRGKLVAADRRH